MTQNHAVILEGALEARLQSPFSDRTWYLGASEVGQCLRAVIANKRTKPTLDRASQGRMLAGRALENEVVQLLRLAVDHQIRDTGRAQREYHHPELPFRAHPDGRLVREGGDGVLEVKTASASTFKRYQRDGLPPHYIDQVQAQMGLSGLTWAMVVLVSRESLGDVETFELAFDPDHYKRLEARARAASLYLLDHSTAGLPDGEPDRGFCHTCPHSTSCTALAERRGRIESGILPEIVSLQLDAQVEELALLEASVEPMQTRIADLRELIRYALESYGTSKVALDMATVHLVTNTRTSFDSKALQRESPELFSRYLKTSTYATLRVTFRNAPQRAS